MTTHAHTDLTAGIAKSRDEFLAAFAGVSAEVAAKKPAPDQWSAYEVAEHLASAQNGFLKRLKEAACGNAPAHDSQAEQKFRAGLRDRTHKRPAPPAAHPNGRFGDLAGALAAFRSASDEAIAFIDNCPDLLALHTEHPVFGPMNGRAIAAVLCEHPQRHLQQVREVLAAVS